MKNWIKYLIGIAGLLLLVMVVSVLSRNDWKGRVDYKIGVVGSDGLGLVSISPERRMVNNLNIDGAVEVWLPGGRGWYRSDRVGRILEEDKKEGLGKEMFFYNFGFWPNMVITINKHEEWIKKITPWDFGLLNWIKWSTQEGNMVRNENKVSKSVGNNEQLPEILLRDYSDSKWLNSPVRISVVNTTGSSGLAQFVGDRLEWSGMGVLSVENEDKQVEKCIIEVSPDLDHEKIPEVGFMKDRWNCVVENRKNLSSDEVYLYLGKGFESMIKYDTYNRPE